MARQLLAAITLALAVAYPTHAQNPSGSPSPAPVGGVCPTVPAPSLSNGHDELSAQATTSPSSPTPVTTEPATWPTLPGVVRHIADALFAARWPVGVWTGERVIVTDLVGGRTLSYDPARDQWHRLARSPAGIDLGRAFWTGDEMILVGDVGDFGGVTAWEFDPDADSWSELVRAPFAGSLVDAAWQAGYLVARIDPEQPGQLDSGITFHILDTSLGCWRNAARPDPIDADLVGVAEGLLAVGPLSVSVLDPGTGTWSDPVPRPTRDDTPGIVVDDRIVFLTDGKGGESYDPVMGTWTTIETSCPILSGSSIPAGTLVIDGSYAFDTASATCYRLPDMSDDDRRFAFQQWMADRLLLWSGSKGEESPPGPDGITFEPLIDSHR